MTGDGGGRGGGSTLGKKARRPSKFPPDFSVLHNSKESLQSYLSTSIALAISGRAAARGGGAAAGGGGGGAGPPAPPPPPPHKGDVYLELESVN